MRAIFSDIDNLSAYYASLKSKELEGTEKQDLGDENNAQDLGDIPF